MSGITVSKTIRHREMVSPVEINLRNALNNPPPAYLLSDKHKRLIKGYTDATYTFVELKTGEIIRTRDFQQRHVASRGRRKDYIPSNRKVYQVVISSYISSRFNYNGLHFNILGITYGDGYMTFRMKFPKSQEYMLDCTLDTNGIKDAYILNWIHNFVGLMIMNHESMMKGKLSKKAQEAYDTMMGGKIVDTRFIIEDTAMEHSFGPEVANLVDEIITGGLIDDDENCPIDIDIKTMLNLAKLNNRLIHVQHQLRKKYFETIKHRLIKGSVLWVYMWWAICRLIPRTFRPLNKHIMVLYDSWTGSLDFHTGKDSPNTSIPPDLNTAILFMEYKLGNYGIPDTLKPEVIELLIRSDSTCRRLKLFLKLMKFS